MKTFISVLIIFISFNLKGQNKAESSLINTYKDNYDSLIFYRPESTESHRLNSYVKFEVTYQDVSENAKVAFNEALKIYQAQLISKIPIRINLKFTGLDDNVLASSGAKTIFKNFSNAQKSEVWYPVALAESLSAQELNNNETDIEINVSNKINWSFNISTNISSNSYDFISVMVHELAHGLGFASSANVDFNTNKGSFGYKSSNYIFDEFIVDGYKTFLNTYVNPSSDLKNALTSNGLQFYCDRLNTGKKYIPLYAPPVFSQGASISHFPLFSNTIMVPSIARAQIYRDLDDQTLSVLYQLGWGIQNLNGAVITEIEPKQNSSIVIYPNPAGKYLSIKPTQDISAISIYDFLGQQIKNFNNNFDIININELAAGIYLVKIETNSSKIIIKRFIKSN